MRKLSRKFRIIRGFLKSRINKTPFILSHVITRRCNLLCPFCLWRGDSHGELSFDQIMEIYRKARLSGVELLIIWGGEPLLRDDIGKILQEAGGLGFLTSIITNGELLLDRYNELVPFVDFLFVSLDAPSEEHDRIRGSQGLFKKIDTALKIITKSRNSPDVALVCVLSKENLRFIEDMVFYGMEIGIPVIFQALNKQDYSPGTRVLEKMTSLPTSFEEEIAARRIIELKRRGFPICNSSAYLEYLMGIKTFRCHYKKAVLRIEAKGEIFDCTSGVAFGNAMEMEFRNFFNSKTYKDFLKRAELCNRCRDAGVVGISFLWEKIDFSLLRF